MKMRIVYTAALLGTQDYGGQEEKRKRGEEYHCSVRVAVAQERLQCQNEPYHCQRICAELSEAFLETPAWTYSSRGVAPLDKPGLQMKNLRYCRGWIVCLARRQQGPRIPEWRMVDHD